MNKKKKGFVAEFREFALKGNMLDLAVGVIIGGAFQSIVNSIVKDLIMPLIGIITGGVDFTQKFVFLGKVPSVTLENGTTALADISTLEKARAVGSVFAYGSFITAVINFIIMAFVIFLFVKGINSLKKIKKKPDEAPDTPTEKECPFCKMNVPVSATRCGHCTSELPETKQ